MTTLYNWSFLCNDGVWYQTTNAAGANPPVATATNTLCVNAGQTTLIMAIQGQAAPGLGNEVLVSDASGNQYWGTVSPAMQGGYAASSFLVNNTAGTAAPTALAYTPANWGSVLTITSGSVLGFSVAPAANSVLAWDNTTHALYWDTTLPSGGTVTLITTASGIATAANSAPGGTITTTGSLYLAGIAAQSVLANATTTATQTPVGFAISAGTLLCSTTAGLANTTNAGATSGASFLQWNGTGTAPAFVTITAGTGLSAAASGTPAAGNITTTVSLAQIPAVSVLANATNAAAQPSGLAITGGQVLASTGTALSSTTGATAGYMLTYTSATTVPTFQLKAVGFCAWSQSATGVAAAETASTPASGGFLVRQLTQSLDSSVPSGLSLNAGTYTITAANTGSYLVTASAPCQKLTGALLGHKIALWDTSGTPAVVLPWGTSEVTTTTAQTRSTISSVVTLTATHTYVLRHYVGTVGGTWNWGAATGAAVSVEVYAVIQFTKLT